MLYIRLIISVFIFTQLSFLYGQSIQLTQLPAQFDRPVDVKTAGDDRLFVVEKIGRIWIMTKEGQKSPTPFLDITTIVNAGANERGLLGLAFHPNYDSTGYFYVNYTGSGGHTRISRFSRDPVDPDKALANSELILMTVNQPFNNHNAGDLAFGPDGYLYIPMGDGGSGGDPGNRSQNPKELLGKMLRIDVNNGMPYAIPGDNPFAGSLDTLPEIWALGLRNTWRVSFDRLTGDFWMADVGQGSWEEINMEPAGSTGGKNWGWRCYEGFAPYNTSGCGPIGTYDPPIHVYPNNPNSGCSVTGGYVYRGAKWKTLYGKYLYADYCSGRFWTLWPDGMGGWNNIEVLKGPNFEYSAFGEDEEGELYVATLGEGRIYKIGLECNVTAAVVSYPANCEGVCDGSIVVQPSGGCEPYTFNLIGPDGVEMITSDSLIVDLCAGSYSLIVTDCSGCTYLQNIVIGTNKSLIVTSVYEDPKCFDSCDGEVFLNVQNGCPPYSISYVSENNEVITTNDPQLNGLCAGLYIFEIRDCEGCLVLHEIELSQPDPPGVLQIMDMHPTCSGFCNGGVTTELLGGCPPLTYTLVNQSTGAILTQDAMVFDSLCADNYLVIAKDCNGCTLEESITLLDPFPFPIFLFWSGDTLFANEGHDLYTWYLDDVLLTTTVEHFFVPTTSGVYRATGTHGDNCLSYSNEVEVIINLIDNPESSQLNVMPNPFKDYLLVQIMGSYITQYQVYDVFGRMASPLYNAVNQQIEVSFSTMDLPNGFYILRVKDANGNWHSKHLVK